MPPTTDDIADLRRALAHAEAVIAELRGVVGGRLYTSDIVVGELIATEIIET